MGYKLSNIKNSPFKDLDYSYITSDYGMRSITINGKTTTKKHKGIDMTSGSIIVAVEGGEVISTRNTVAGYSETYTSGNYVKIKHNNGVISVYYHLKKGSIKVKVGDKVKKGEIIGEKGSTGYVTGPHLHFGIYVNNEFVDPKPYLLGTKTFENVTNSYTVVKGD